MLESINLRNLRQVFSRRVSNQMLKNKTAPMTTVSRKRRNTIGINVLGVA
jgi:hypothetical protein